MKKIALLLWVTITLFFISSCTNQKQADIVTTMFPQYDFARQIVGDYMTVSLIVPPGVEVHSYEVTPKDMVAIKEAKLFIFTSLEIDTWIKDPSKIGGNDTVVMDLSNHYTLDDMEHNHLLSLTIEDDHEHEDELHYWTDPMIAIQLIEAIMEEIIALDPENEAVYTQNANDYIAQIDALHHALDDFIQSGYVDTKIYFAGHNAMSLFGKRYHLDITSLFESFKPDADLTSAELIQFTKLVSDENIHYLFIEELVEPKAALQIVNELASKDYELNLLVLHGYHNITSKEKEEGARYIDLFSSNINHIKLALNNQ